MGIIKQTVERRYIYIIGILLFSSNVLLYHSSNVLFENDFVVIFKVIIKSIANYFSGAFIPLLGVIMLEYVGNNRLMYIYETLSIILYGLVFFIDIFMFIKFHSFIDQAKMEILLAADPYTIKEFLLLYVLNVNIFVLIFLFTLIIFFFKNKVLSFLAGMKKYLIKTICICTVSFIALGVNSYVRFGKAELCLSNFYRNSGVGRIIIDTYAAINSAGSDSMVYETIKNSDETIIKCDSDVPYIVLILGESTDRNKMSAYGYKNKTTPLLDERIDNNEVVLFTDTIACANYTSKAMQLIFSFCEKDSNKNWYEYGNMLDIFNRAGYKTTWISNQTPVGRYGNMDKVLAKIAKSRKFTSMSGGSDDDENKRSRDDEILPLLDTALEDNINGKNFYVIHLEGTHEDYKLRYPKEFEKFTEKDESSNNIIWNKVRAEYDNAVLFNDYIIDEIIRRFENKEAVIIYFSDHGSEVYDGRDFMGHSSEEYGNKHMIEIPFFVWASNSYWRKNDNIKKQMNNVRNMPYSTENIIHFFMDIAKIKTKSYDESKSILSLDNIYLKKARVYGGKIYKKTI